MITEKRIHYKAKAHIRKLVEYFPLELKNKLNVNELSNLNRLSQPNNSYNILISPSLEDKRLHLYTDFLHASNIRTLIFQCRLQHLRSSFNFLIKKNSISSRIKYCFLRFHRENILKWIAFEDSDTWY
ncbi:hypothetical protein BpHYR1_018059 [Brachionus plicatilis]|uniref:Uncharacterized protein n=1 Tax=Brachionus plicatilis TaxID=10195 RepID=A0A3M7S3Q5_BRAPC|nr:hypothetical protein BpHYR1_018059 [Brachionus plicatilis]